MPLVENIKSATLVPHTTYFIVEDDESYDTLWGAAVNVASMPNTTMVEKANYFAGHCKEPYIYIGQDDCTFTDGWLTRALELMQFVDGVVAISDGHEQYDSTLFSRRYIQETGTIDRPGLALHPGYTHYYSEVEVCHTAISRGKFAYSPSSVVTHVGGSKVRDETWKRNTYRLMQDRALFYSRAPLWGGATYHTGRPNELVEA